MSLLLAVVVSYNPSAELLENVQALLEQVSHVVIVDNGSSEETRQIFSSIPTDSVSFILNSKNLGIAKGINQGVRWGLERNYEYFLLMDQDSRPAADLVTKLLDVLNGFLSQGKFVLIGPHHEDYERKIEHSYVNEIEEVPLLITSGCLLSKKVIDNIGLYDERLFIDHVDHDYCLRLMNVGGASFKVHSATLLHRFGEAKVKTIFGKSFFVQDYSPFRRYYMMRNRLVLYKRYGMFRDAWFWLDFKVAIKDLVKVVVFESNKMAKLTAIGRGLVAGLLWKDR